MQEPRAVHVTDAMPLVEQEHLQHVAVQAGPGAVVESQPCDRLAEVLEQRLEVCLVRGRERPVGERLVQLPD